MRTRPRVGARAAWAVRRRSAAVFGGYSAVSGFQCLALSLLWGLGACSQSWLAMLLCSGVWEWTVFCQLKIDDIAWPLLERLTVDTDVYCEACPWLV